MEESKEDLKSKNSKKTRTHIPVDGYKIEQLRELPIETLIDIANDLDVDMSVSVAFSIITDVRKFKCLSSSAIMIS